MKEDNVILEKSFSFAERIINLYKYVIANEKEFVLSKQVLRSGTSIGANVEEAIGGVSSKDFQNKIGTAYKEARETKYWLRLLKSGKYIDDKMFESIFQDADELVRILGSILKTLKLRKNKK